MAVMMILDWHGVSIEDYDRVEDEIGISGDDDAPEGLISHVAAVDEDGEMVIADIWESDEALATFIETKLGPALRKLALPESEPRIMPVHNRLRGSADEADALILIELEDTSTDTYDEMASQMEEHAGDGSGHPSYTHAVATEGSTMIVLDEWESADHFSRFMEERIVTTAPEGMGQPKVRALKVYNRVRGQAHAGA